MYLLDTNILSELRKAEQAEPKVRRWFDEAPEVALFTSVLVIAEIEAGIARKRASDPSQSAHLDTWLELVLERFGARVIHVDTQIARRFGTFAKARTYPVVDGLLAATALERDLILVTRNIEDVAGTGARVLNPFVSKRVRRA